MVETLFFSKRKCLSKNLFITPVEIIFTALVDACKVLKKFHYYKYMIITLKVSDAMFIRRYNDKTDSALFINLLSSFLICDRKNDIRNLYIKFRKKNTQVKE